MKRLVRCLFSEKQWNLLSREKRAFLHFLNVRLPTALGRAAGSCAGVLPLRIQAGLKESMNPVAYLDYPNRPIRMRVNSTVQIGRLRACGKEPETVRWIETHIRLSDVLYDIGANVGGYSLIAWAASNGRARVYAFEPSYPTFAELNHNILLNRAEQGIIPLCMALSERTELLELEYNDLSPGTSMHHLEEIGGEERAYGVGVVKQKILSCRLDDLTDILGVQAPTLVKMDVDGCELRVLKGAEKTLASQTLRSILLEVDPEHPSTFTIQRYLEERGFALSERHCYDSSGAWWNYVFSR